MNGDLVDRRGREVRLPHFSWRSINSAMALRSSPRRITNSICRLGREGAEVGSLRENTDVNLEAYIWKSSDGAFETNQGMTRFATQMADSLAAFQKHPSRQREWRPKL